MGIGKLIKFNQSSVIVGVRNINERPDSSVLGFTNVVCGCQPSFRVS